MNHLRQDSPAGVEDADDVGFENFRPRSGFLFVERTNGTLNGRVRDQDMNSTPGGGHPVHGGADFIEPADVAAKAHGHTAGIFDFDLSRIQFTLAAAKQTDPCTRLRKSDCEAFSNSSSGAGDQDSCILLGTQRGILYRRQGHAGTRPDRPGHFQSATSRPDWTRTHEDSPPDPPPREDVRRDTPAWSDTRPRSARCAVPQSPLLRQ